jgi:hypothetical protein
MWAHLRRKTPQTGLSAAIPQPLRGLRDFRCNPLRPTGLSGFGTTSFCRDFFSPAFASLFRIPDLEGMVHQPLWGWSLASLVARPCNPGWQL